MPLLWIALVAAQLAGPPVDQEVIVTARPLSALRADWEQCLRAGCPPRVEMDRAMAYAEGQLISGEYRGSWRTLRITKQRNMRYAETLPLDVARIARASSRMANLNGEPVMSRVNAFETVGALRRGLLSSDARILMAKLDIGDAYIPDGKVDFALAKYASIAKEAMRAKKPAVVADATFRRAVLFTALTAFQPMYRSSARKAINQLIASADPAFASYRDPARLVAINLMPARQQKGALETMVASLTPRAPDDLLLAYAPPLDPSKLVVESPDRNAAQQWADIRYEITADGRVRNPTTVRASPDFPGFLSKAAATSLMERRYAPLTLPAGSTDVVHYARYTFVFDPVASGTREDGSISRVPKSDNTPRVDVFDLGTELVRRD